MQRRESANQINKEISDTQVQDPNDVTAVAGASAKKAKKEAVWKNIESQKKGADPSQDGEEADNHYDYDYDGQGYEVHGPSPDQQDTNKYYSSVVEGGLERSVDSQEDSF